MIERFIKERRFIGNVSPRIVDWYRESFKCSTTQSRLRTS
jgi:hypothetical protein